MGLGAAQVATQVASVMMYLAQAKHVAWDVHFEDIMLNCHGSRVHLTMLDIFMRPDECLGSSVFFFFFGKRSYTMGLQGLWGIWR